MPDSCFNLERAYVRKQARNYPKLYWAIDLHDTIIEGKFSKWNEGREFYTDAKEVLQNLSKRDDMCIILWSSSQMDSILDIKLWLKNNDINVDYINSNPEMPTGHLCDFSNKFAFDIGLDDKFGFYGPTDWTIIKNKLKELNLWSL